MEIKVLKNILDANDQIAQNNQTLLDSQKIFGINIMSSPGAGKTSLITETIKHLNGTIKIGVIEGDVASCIDAEKISLLSVPVIQINTGGSCHLNANSIQAALAEIPLDKIRRFIPRLNINPFSQQEYAQAIF